MARIFDPNPEDVKRVTAKLSAMEHNAIGTLPVMQRIGMDMMRITGVQFRSSGRRGGGSWARIKPSTFARKGNYQILKTKGSKPGYSRIGKDKRYENNDTLFKSLVFHNTPYQIMSVRNGFVVYGTNRPGAAAHQHGAGKVPPRPFLVFLPGDRKRWNEMIARHIVKPFHELTIKFGH